MSGRNTHAEADPELVEEVVIEGGEEDIAGILGGDFHAHEAELTQVSDAPEPEEEDPYEVLERQFAAAQAEAKAAQDQRDEALREKQALQQRVDTFAVSEMEGHKVIIEHAIAAANGEREEARRAYRQAREVGDLDAELAASEALSEANDKLRQLQAGHAQIEQHLQNPPKTQGAPAASQADPVEQLITQNFPNPKDQAWLRQHKQDIFGNEDRKELALAGHKVAVLKHKIQPGTDAYYAFLDDHMGYGAASAAPKPAAVAPRKKVPVLPGAPVSRSSANLGSSVRVTPEIASLARDLGMTASEYIQSQADIASGKTHHRFT